jgi:hypothetical protein
MPADEQIGASKLTPTLLISSKYAYLRDRFRDNSNLPEM